MPKTRAPSMNLELLEYLKFLHLHNLVDIISIIDSIPIYYQTQIRKYAINDIENINHQKHRLQNLTYIAKHLYCFSFPNFVFDFQTWRVGPYSLDLDNGLQNLIYSDVFNNAISSRKTFAKRYKITDYDKQFMIQMFKDADNYRNFLALVDGKDIYYLKDISLVVYWNNHCSHNNIARKYKPYTKTRKGMNKLLRLLLKGLTRRNNDNEYVEELINLLPNQFSQQQVQSLQNQS
jgi:hypothetical protein